MDFEQYKGKLLEVEGSLRVMKKLITKECGTYIKCLEDMHDIGDPRRIELKEAVEKEIKEKLYQIENQICFIGELRDKVTYQQLYKEILNKQNLAEEKKSTNEITESKEKMCKWINTQNIFNNQNILSSNLSNQKSSSDKSDSAGDKFAKAISDFIKALNNNNLRHNTLCLSREWSKKLSKYNLIKWKEFDEEIDITLEETNDTPTYYAYEISSKPSYYFLTPADGIGINEFLAVQYAYLAFFDFSTDELGMGKKPVVVKPAIVMLKDGIYSFVRKGILKF